MKVHQIYTNSPLRNFNYIIEGDQGHCYVIDPLDGQFIIDYVAERNLLIRGIINTHEHYDHIYGNDIIVKKTMCPVYSPSGSLERISEANVSLSDGDTVEVDDRGYIEVIETPGHLVDHICLKIIEGTRCTRIITGDTLFKAGKGNCRRGGDINLYFETIESKFRDLSDDVIVYPAHEYLENNLTFTLSIEPENQKAKNLLKEIKGIDWDREKYQTTMGIERQINCFLRLNKETVATSVGGSNKKEIFINLRKLRDQW
jgi:hydroxyacylglutathione hydrolase